MVDLGQESTTRAREIGKRFDFGQWLNITYHDEDQTETYFYRHPHDNKRRRICSPTLRILSSISKYWEYHLGYHYHCHRHTLSFSLFNVLRVKKILILLTPLEKG